MAQQLPPAQLLEGLLLGDPISSHHGVRCCPAIREGTDEKYIVKIISIPATAGQLEALLLTGACTDETQALNYFRELAEGVAQEADLLRRLSALEGFTDHLGWEIQPSSQGIGYDICLLSPYKPTLAKLMKEAPLTHLAAVNLGLDLCAALTACRRLGYLYADLRPENVFFSENQGYRIGDLGFISLTSLPYASLPEKYRSCYTAPEINDAMSSLNDTMDIYALGLILYQVFNNGQLPFDGSAPSRILPAPLYADYEMAEIILKACAPDPTARWQDPAQMGQELVNYMQRNSVNATPIIPAPVILEDPEAEDQGFLTEEENNAQLAPLLEALPEEIDPQQMAMDGSCQSLSTEETAQEEDDPSFILSETDEEQLSFLDDLYGDEAPPSVEDSAAVTEEVAQMLAQADELLAHELPEPVVAPGPIDVPVPPLPIEKPEGEPSLENEAELPPAADMESEIETGDTPEENDDEEYISQLPPQRRTGRWIALVTVVLLLLAAAVGGYIWYQHIYTQTIDALTIQGDGNVLTVRLDCEIDESLLSVVCTDTYGNTLRQKVIGGVATFTDLLPATQYRIRVEIKGLHRLVGSVNGVYSTEPQTEVLHFTAVCGPEDGSVILNFSVNDSHENSWNVHISAAGEPDRTQAFTGHTVTIFGLTPGTQYTFRLISDSDAPLAGQTETIFTAQSILRAEDLTVTACGGGSMTVQWSQPNAPQGQVWLLRCYNGTGYDETFTTTDLTYTFTGLDHSTGYTVIVTAEGMPQSVSTSITAEPINVTGYTVSTEDPYKLMIQWTFTGAAPENGWSFIYQLDGGNQITLACPENIATLAVIPGCSYEFMVRPTDDITFFTQSSSYTAGEMPVFQGFGITADDLTIQTVLRPEGDDWSYQDLTADSYRCEFTEGERAGLLMKVGKNFSLSDEPVAVVFAIRDDSANLISAETINTTWEALWSGVYCALDIPVLPQSSGSYTLSFCINGMLIAQLTLTVI